MVMAKIQFNSEEANGRMNQFPSSQAETSLFPPLIASLIDSVRRLGLPVTHSKQRTEDISNPRRSRGICNIHPFLVSHSNYGSSANSGLHFHRQLAPILHPAAIDTAFISVDHRHLSLRGQ